MKIEFGREICGDLAISEHREWLVTNGIGGYAAGTISGILSRRYHGLLLAALKPPLGRTLLLSKLDEIISYSDRFYFIHANRWADKTVTPEGYQYIESFYLDGTTPVWIYSCADALLEKRIWMQQGENTTYISYRLLRGNQTLSLSLKALVNYRDYHGSTQSNNWQMQIEPQSQGIVVKAFPNAASLYLFSTTEAEQQINWQINHTWYEDFALAVERYRGLSSCEDHLYAGTCEVKLNLGESLTIVASTKSNLNLDIKSAWQCQQQHEQKLLKFCQCQAPNEQFPDWIKQLVLAADQFIVDRPLEDEPGGKTVIAGYPWFGDWGRDTMISLPGLTLATGRPDLAKIILRTFAKYIDKGMLPNLFPDAGETPEYNTVDATLWYFEAIRNYFALTKDEELLQELFPALAEIIDWHCRGTRYSIHLDDDGLLYAGEEGVQLTWMDAKVGEWVVTPRIGKPVEVNALWYNALVIMGQFAQHLGKSAAEYQELTQKTRRGFQRFWNPNLDCCYDVLDTPNGNDDSLRPNQIFAVSLPFISEGEGNAPILDGQQQKKVVDKVAQLLLTSHGLRSLAANHPYYQGHYGGNPLQRDGAYHQGTVWSWLLGHFVQAHLKIYQNQAIARTFLEPMANHLQAGCVGNLSEIFDGDAPFQCRGAFAQAWTVAEILRGWFLTKL